MNTHENRQYTTQSRLYTDGRKTSWLMRMCEVAIHLLLAIGKYNYANAHIALKKSNLNNNPRGLTLKVLA
jgi:hypothetical protein